MSDEMQFSHRQPMQEIPFKNCILIGVGALPDKLKCDGDILFATPDNVLLISEGIIYLNNHTVGVGGVEVINTIRDAIFCAFGQKQEVTTD